MDNFKPPKTYLAESILVTLFCCLPFGIVAIIHAAKVDSLYNGGSIEMAYYKSQKAKKYVNISFWIGLVLNLLIFLANIIPATN